MTNPGVYICVRRTIDWRDESAIDAAFRPKVLLWNSQFRVPYHHFRLRLKEIAQENLARVEGAVVTELDEVPAGALVVPVDDDDWFAPELVAHLRAAHAPDARGYHWPRFVLEARPGWLRRADHRRYTCGTNNYAFVHEGAWSGLAAGHTIASEHFDAHAEQTRALSRMLSIQNRNLSSQTQLGFRGPPISPRRLRRKFRRFCRLYRKAALPDELKWAEPHVAEMAELMDALRA